jgi:hypothetical protein
MKDLRKYPTPAYSRHNSTNLELTMRDEHVSCLGFQVYAVQVDLMLFASEYAEVSVLVFTDTFTMKAIAVNSVKTATLRLQLPVNVDCTW